MKVDMEEREYINWGEISVGECFVFNGELYMKIKEIDKFNSVCLNDGNLECFSNEDYLEFADAHAVVDY
jgi:hypothetical protein